MARSAVHVKSAGGAVGLIVSSVTARANSGRFGSFIESARSAQEEAISVVTVRSVSEALFRRSVPLARDLEYVRNARSVVANEGSNATVVVRRKTSRYFSLRYR